MSNFFLTSSTVGGLGHCYANDDIDARIRFSATPFFVSADPFSSVKLCSDPFMTLIKKLVADWSKNCSPTSLYFFRTPF